MILGPRSPRRRPIKSFNTRFNELSLCDYTVSDTADGSALFWSFVGDVRGSDCIHIEVSFLTAFFPPLPSYDDLQLTSSKRVTITIKR